ncbi:hypothetical protein Y032_0648g1109 [Ancylostoma ceylanicum]|nr:hypothetical protein Y032_0648g1109 [Ancylostoma ceylanicum]
MVRYGQRSHFLYQLNTHTQRGRPIADLEDLVLRLYHAKHDYDPLLDELHPLRDWIYTDLKRGYERYCSVDAGRLCYMVPICGQNPTMDIILRDTADCVKIQISTSAKEKIFIKTVKLME